MRMIKRLLAGLSLTLMAAAPSAFAADPTNGLGYLTQARPLAAESSGGKVEVLEFFSYHCPHCFALDPVLEAWAKRNKDTVIFKRVHVYWGEPDSTAGKMLSGLQRAFYTLEAMGKGEEMHKKLFDALHVERAPLQNEDAVVKYLAKNGIDSKKYLETANSFAVQSKVQRARSMFASANLEGVPNLIVDGRYLTSPLLASRGRAMSDAQGNQELTRVLDTLVAKVAAERGKSAAKPSAPADQKKK